jgi:hypothetical protein
MKDTSRRGFLTVAGVGAAAAGVAAAVPSAAAAPKPPDIGDAEGPLVAYVTDVRTSEVALLVGEREVVVHDKDLVARLNHAAKGSAHVVAPRSAGDQQGPGSRQHRHLRLRQPGQGRTPSR